MIGPKVAATARKAYAEGRRQRLRGVSPREEALWPLLREHGWQWRHRWFDAWGCFEMDFALYEEKLDVEIDGLEHLWPKNRAKDERRDAELMRRGWRVIRISNARVDASATAVAVEILALI